MKGIENLGSSEPVKFMKEAVDDFKKYIGEITGLRHLRPQSIDGTIEALKKTGFTRKSPKPIWVTGITPLSKYNIPKHFSSISYACFEEDYKL